MVNLLQTKTRALVEFFKAALYALRRQSQQANAANVNGADAFGADIWPK